MDVAILLALLLHRPAGLVSTIYDVAGIEGVAICEYESQFNDHACRREYEGTSWGLFQLWSKYHEQHREDLLLHIVAGTAYWTECKEKAGGDIAKGYSVYNSGNTRHSIEKGREVERLRDFLARRVAEAVGVNL